MADYITELLVDGVWQNITPDVRDRAPIVMERGRRDWATDTDPSTCTLTLNNGESRVSAGVQGRYSPRNPRSDLYGKIGRNTPLRVRDAAAGDEFLVLPGFESSYLTTPDHADLDITGDFDLRIDIEPTTWRPADGMGLARKYDLNGDQRSWALWLNAAGTLSFRWSPDGTFASSITVVSDAIPETSTRLAVRVVLDVNNGAGGNDVLFYTAPSIDGTYTQLGATDTGAGLTSIHSGTAPVEVGRINDPEGTGILTGVFQGTMYALSLRSVIAGTEVANPDFTAQTPQTRTFTDAAGQVWTLNASATFVDTSIRFTGEVYTWPPEWDLSGADRWVKVKAAGLTRRLQQGTKPLKSSLFRDLSIKDDIVAYWPMEEPKGSTRFTSGLPDDDSFLAPITATEINVAADDETFFSSAPLPTVEDTSIAGNVNAYTGANDQRFVFLLSIPDDVTWAAEKTIARIYTTDTVKRWDIAKTSGDSTRLYWVDADGVRTLLSSFSMTHFGIPCAVSLWLQQDGTGIDWQVAKFPLDGSGATAFTGTLASNTYGRISRVVLGTNEDTGMESSTFGHAFILNDDVQSIWDTIDHSMVGWEGETGLERLVRLTNDENLPAVRSIGLEDGETMGFQSIKTLMTLFREVPTAALGILTDRPDAIGLQYRSRVDLYSQDPVLTLDYSNGVIDDPFRPVDDDQNIVNEVTVSRPRGSSLTAADTTGPLSSLDPPSGVGKYDISQEINIDTDERLEDQAFWRLHLGTVDEARFPTVRLNLRNERVEAMEDDILSVTEGDIIRITNPPVWLPGGPYDLMVEAIREEKSAVEHYIEFACSPGSAWDALILDSAEYGRLDTGGSTLGEALTTTQTVFDVATDAGSQVWMRQDVGLVMDGTSSSVASTPDAAALDIVGDIEIRVEMQRDSWSDVTAVQDLVEKWGAAGTRSFLFRVDTGGFLRLFWSTDGTATANEISEVPLPLLTGGRIAVKAVLDVSTGNVTFSYSDSIDGTYTQLGAVQTGSATSIFSGSSGLVIGRDDASAGFAGTIFHARVYNSAGTVVANPDFTAHNGAGSFTDSAGLVWTVGSAARIEPNDPFDIIVGGEVMTVHSITGTTSPQEFTVLRAVNGVVKAHTSGTAVALAKPSYLSL